MGYAIGPDGFSIKYTGQYRDTETGLDYFNARYYSPTQGRFVSPDPGNAGANLGDPATWNGYAYVGGNPVNVTDPSGEGWLNWLGGALEVLSLVPGLQWLAPIGAVISGGSTINSLGGFSTGGGGGINGGPWDEQISIASGKGIPQWAVWDILRSDAPWGSDNYRFYVGTIDFLLTDPKAAGIINQLKRSRKVYTLRMNSGATNHYDPSTQTVAWDPQHSLFTTNGGCLSPATVLAHELGHAANDDQNSTLARRLAATSDPVFDDLEEKRTITGVEWSVSRLLRERLRPNHRADITKGIRGISRALTYQPVIGVCR